MDGSCRATSPAAFDWNPWVGMPFESLGQGSHDFFCWYLVRAILREAKGILLPSFSELNRTPIATQTGQLLDAHYGTYGFGPVPVAEAQPFDVLVFRSTPGSVHVGVVVSRGKFLHGGRGLDSCIERYTAVQWRHRIIGLYRYHR